VERSKDEEAAVFQISLCKEIPLKTSSGKRLPR